MSFRTVLPVLSEYGVLIGALLSVAGSLLDNLGFTMQKLSHIQHPTVIEYWRMPRWQAGFGLFILGNIFNALSLTLAPQSIFSSLGCLSIVFNVINARLFAGERITLGICCGTILIVAGSGLAVAFGANSVAGHVFQLDELWDRMKSSTACMLLVFAWTITTVALYVSIRHHKPQLELPAASSSLVTSSSSEHEPGRTLPAKAKSSTSDDLHLSVDYFLPDEGLSEYHPAYRLKTDDRTSWSAVPSIPASTSLHTNVPETLALSSIPVHGHTYLSISLPVFAGLLASVMVTFAKTVVEILKQGWSELNFVSTWLVIVCTIVLASVQLDTINKALRQCSQLSVIPIYLSCFTIVSVLFGLVVFDEVSTFREIDWIVFPCSMVLTLLGVGISFVASHQKRRIRLDELYTMPNPTSLKQALVQSA